jgi:O-antigen/teichoic acid export membrane protein
VKQPQSASQRVAKNTGILYAKMGITMFISLYTTRLILSSLGASDFGIFGIVGTAIAMLGFLNAAMAVATQRFMSYAEGEGNKDKQKNIFNISVVLHFGIAVLLGIVLLGAGYFFFNGVLNIPEERMYAARMIYYFMIVSAMFTVMTVPYDAVLNAHENMLYYAIVGIIESILKLAVALIVVYTLSDKLIVYGALMAGISLSVMIIMRVYCHRKYEECVFHPRRYYDKVLMKEMSGFAGWSFLGNVSQTIANSGQGFVINIFFGTVINAAQGIAGQINGQLGVFSATLMKALNPVIAKSEGGGNRKLMIDATMMGCKISFFLMAFVSIPALIEMPYILNIWLGADSVPEYAVIFCRLQLIRTLIEQLFGTVASSIAAHGNIKKYEIVSSVFCYFPLIVSFLLFKAEYPPYFLYAVFIAYTVFASGIITFFAWNNYRFPVSAFLKKVLLKSLFVFLAVLGISLIPFSTMDGGLLRLALVLTAGGLSFPVIGWYAGLNNNERERLKQSIIPIIHKFLK